MAVHRRFEHHEVHPKDTRLQKPKASRNSVRLSSRHLKMHARLFLQIAEDAEKVLGLRIAARTELRIRLLGAAPRQERREIRRAACLPFL